MINRFAFAVAIAALGMIPAARAQASPNHVEIGIFADYTNFEATHTNSVGLGGRVGFNIARHVQLEGEISYDFAQAFTETFTDPSTTTVTVARSNFQLLDGLFGPKFQTRGRVKFFATVKGGFIHAGLNDEPGSAAGFVSTVQSLRMSNVDGAFYPGVGLEGFIGPVGLRLDVGDLMYFDSGVHHDVRITFGPSFRF
jgi:hypothetical protein